jgi:hypothetical protein
MTFPLLLLTLAAGGGLWFSKGLWPKESQVRELSEFLGMALTSLGALLIACAVVGRL